MRIYRFIAILAIVLIASYSWPIQFAYAASPTILDSLPITGRTGSATSDSFAYTVPAGNNKCTFIIYTGNGTGLTASLNGSSFSAWTRLDTPITRAWHYYAYLCAPTSGTLSISWTNSGGYYYWIFTTGDTAQTNPIDASAVNDLTTSGASLSTNVTTTVGNDLLVDEVTGALNVTHSMGTGQTEIFMGAFTDPYGKTSLSSKPAGTVAGTETMTRNFSGNDNNDDLAVIAIKYLAPPASAQPIKASGGMIIE